nr:hypothetical protein CFP56_20303 [Quercus suber]
MGNPRNRTPPAAIQVIDYDNLLCPGGSASTTSSSFPEQQDWSPGTVFTNASTPPPRSPRVTRDCGPLLLPRVRPQDQVHDVSANAHYYAHNRTTSLPTNGFPIQFGGHLPTYTHSDRRSKSPPGPVFDSATLSAPSPFDHMINDHASSHLRRPVITDHRSTSATNVRTHSRNVSSSSIDASMLSRYGYPTYRLSPTPHPGNHGSTSSSRSSSALSHLAPMAMSGSHMQAYPNHRRTASPSPQPSRLSTEVTYDPVLDRRTSTCLEYLTNPNPAPHLVQRISEGHRGQSLHFWWDVRNVRAWSDFSIATISAIPELRRLLQIPVVLRDLPEPVKVNTNPETAVQLADLCAFHHAVKVNAALKITQGSGTHIAMRSLRSAPGARAQPEFVSSYQTDQDRTIFGDGRGRVIGIIKCYEQWNSGMRNGQNPEKVKYLQSLAHLQRFMREHETRYGFIMTEIELVCVRVGGAPSDTSNVPLFGHLEVAASVQISASGTGPGGNMKMTAGLALWWLHMLAKERPIPGQYHWKMDVGGPAALTRQHHLHKDDWIPVPQTKEKRDAKVCRGWVFPNEPLSKRETGRGRRVQK